MSTIDFQNVIPADLMVPHPTSASKSILRRNLMEITPNEGSSTYNPLDIIRFDISSNSDFLDGPNSYLRFKLRNMSSAAFDDLVSLDEGGVHCLFRNIEVRSRQSGILLQRIESYNKWAALQSNLYQSRYQVQQVNRSQSDSVHARSSVPTHMELVWHTIDGTIAHPATDGVFTAVTAGVTRRIQVGDYVVVNNPIVAGGMIGGFVKAHSDVSFTLEENEDATTMGPIWIANAGTTVAVYRGGSRSARRTPFVARDTANFIVTMKPLLSILQHTLPLPVMKGGIEILFELEVANKALQSHATYTISDNTANLLAYQIIDPRFMAMMVTPHPDIVKGYMSQWESGGLQYSIPGVHYRKLQHQAAAGEQTSSISIGKRSVKRVYVTQQDSTIHDADSVTARKNRTNSTYLRSTISKFQFKVGSHSFPNREVICDDYSVEALEQLRMVCGNRGPMRFLASEWQSFNAIQLADAAAHRDSTKFIMAADLSRVSGDGSSLSGVDLSIVPLDLIYTRDSLFTAAVAGGYTSLPGVPILHVFAEYDAFLVISDTQVAVFN